MSYSDLTDRAAVEWAIEEFDRLGREVFLERYRYGEAKEYFLVTDEGRYDSKAILAAAYEKQHRVAVASDEISGGKHGAAGRLAELGYVIEGIDDKAGRRTFATFDEALNHYRIPVENLPRVREFLADRSYVEFYIPKSGSYIAAVPEDGANKAFIHSGYIWHRVAKGLGEMVELPVNSLRDGGYSRSARRDRPKDLCSVHFTELPASGICPYC